MDRDKINLDLVNKNVSPSLDVVSNFFELNKSNNFRYFDAIGNTS
jgi:hypothetical protein